MAYNYPYNTYNRYYYGYYGPYYGRTTRSDDEIRADIRSRLDFDSWVNSNAVNIMVNNGVVTLTGDVDTVVEKRAAGDDAWDTPGVLDVINNLRVKQPVTAQR